MPRLARLLTPRVSSKIPVRHWGVAGRARYHKETRYNEVVTRRLIA
jgi:hypothetical protein